MGWGCSVDGRSERGCRSLVDGDGWARDGGIAGCHVMRGSGISTMGWTEAPSLWMPPHDMRRKEAPDGYGSSPTGQVWGCRCTCHEVSTFAQIFPPCRWSVNQPTPAPAPTLHTRLGRTAEGGALSLTRSIIVQLFYDGSGWLPDCHGLDDFVGRCTLIFEQGRIPLG